MMTKEPQAKQFFNLEVVCWIIFWLTLSVVLMTRLRLLGIPLERDEGEYAYLGQLLLQGVPPYKLAYSMKLPGTCAVYALLMAIFGETIKGIHLGFLIINFASAILIFFIARRLSGAVAGIIAATVYALLSVSQSVLGAQAHATHFVVFMFLCGAILLLKAVENDNKKLVFLSGLFFGLAFLMKQQGIFFIPLGILFLFCAYFKKRPALVANLIVYTLGAGLPFIATCLILFCAGVFNKFWFWTFQYAFEYISEIPAYLAYQFFTRQSIQVIKPFEPVWYISAWGFLCLFLDPQARKNIIFLTAFLAVSLLALCPGFIFREHYFVVILPVISILAGIGVNSAVEFIKHKKYPAAFYFVPVMIFAGILALTIFQQRYYLFEATPEEVSRGSYGDNPFIESVKIADYLKANAAPSDTIAVLGSEPQIFFYAARRSATGYIYTYPLMENQPYALSMQQDMAAEIESENPRYLVFVNVFGSWLRQENSRNFIFRWAKDYIDERYDIARAVGISQEEGSYYLDAKNITSLPVPYVLVYKRK